MTRNILGRSEVLGRTVRIDPPPSLAEGTCRKIRQSLADGDMGAARPLIDFFVDEARIIVDIYTQWRRDIRRYLDSKLAGDLVASEADRIQALVAAAHPAMHASRDAAWAAVCSSAERLKSLEAGAPAGMESLDDLREQWRALHDSDVDFMMGLMDVVIRHLGEEAIGEMYEKWVVGEWFDTRYARFDLSKTSWDEAFRGSGGRSVIGEPRDGLKPLMEPPFRFRVLEKEHSFAWNRKGVCTYCAHCCVLTEKLPMEKFGYPIRVVDPPIYPNDGNAVCRWTVYRRVEDVPASVYARLGLAKPAPGTALGSAAFTNPAGGS